MAPVEGSTVIASKGDGHCMFTSIARGLKMGGINRLGKDVYVGVPGLRRIVAASLDETNIEKLYSIWIALENSDLKTAMESAPRDPAGRIEAARAVIERTSAPLYQGDDFALGVISEKLGINFVIMRPDGTPQHGMPELSRGKRFMVLVFHDFEAGVAPTGGTLGHYDLLAFNDRTLFSLDNMPTALAVHLVQHKILPVEATPAPSASQSRGGESEETQEAGAGMAEEDDASVHVPFPVMLEQRPLTSDEWKAALVTTILTIPMRRATLASPTHQTSFKIVSVDDELSVNILATGVTTESYNVEMAINDVFDGEIPLLTKVFDDIDAVAMHVLDADTKSGAGRVIVRIQVSIDGGAFVSIEDVDKEIISRSH